MKYVIELCDGRWQAPWQLETWLEQAEDPQAAMLAWLNGKPWQFCRDSMFFLIELPA